MHIMGRFFSADPVGECAYSEAGVSVTVAPSTVFSVSRISRSQGTYAKIPKQSIQGFTVVRVLKPGYLSADN